MWVKLDGRAAIRILDQTGWTGAVDGVAR